MNHTQTSSPRHGISVASYSILLAVLWFPILSSALAARLLWSFTLDLDGGKLTWICAWRRQTWPGSKQLLMSIF